MTCSNDTPNPTFGYRLSNRSSQAFAAVYALHVLPGVIRCLRHVAVNAERLDLGDRLIWVEAALSGVIAVHEEERLALLRQTPFDRTCRN